MFSINRFVLFVCFALLLPGLLGCQQLVQSAEVEEEMIPELVIEVPPDHSAETLTSLLAANPPARDLADLAKRLRGINAGIIEPRQDIEGTVDSFWYRAGGDRVIEISAELAYQTETLNLWVEDGARARQKDLEEAAIKLENDIFPTTRSFFGVEAQPGLDGDPRINILHLEEIGGSGGTTAVGYFYSADQYSAEINPQSNERDIFYISLKQAPVASERYYEVIAHEFQHMIHSNTDKNEPSWTDEGLAELATYVNGYTNIESVGKYAELPDTQLNNWTHGSVSDLAHYGAGFLFSAYFLDRYGEEATKAVVASEQNGFNGFAAVLDQVDAGTTTDQLFADWVVTNYATGMDSAEKPYSYNNITIDPMTVAATLDELPATYDGGVYQYGVDYIEIESDEPVVVEFMGSQQVQFMSANPQNGDYFVTTFPADRSDMTLTRAFDLTQAEPVTTTLSFHNWYRIEKGWDYGYVLVSADNGESWDMLSSIYTTKANPQGNNYGFGLTGKSGTVADQSVWAEQNMDISAYVGKQILLRFEYVTDDAVYEDGWAIDDISIEQIGYFENFETGLGGWEPAGFVRHTNILPQTYILQAFSADENGINRQPLTLDATQTGSFELDMSPANAKIILTVSGNTPITAQRAAYKLTVSPK